MIQTVGIRFEAQGLAEVTRQMKVLGRGINSLVNAVNKLETLNTSAAITNLNRLATGMGNAASKLVLAANEINAATLAFTNANSMMGRGGGGAGTVQPATTHSNTKDKVGWWGGWEHESGRTAKLAKSLGTFYLLMKGMDAANELATATFLGGDRQRLVDPQLNLHSIGYKTKEEKRDVESAAGDASFFYRGGIKKEEFMKSLAEMGSALPHDDPRAPAMNKQMHIDLAKTAISFGKMSQMTTDAASQLLESLISAQYYMGKPGLKQSMRTQQGFTSQYGSEIAGQSYKAIDIFKMRGQDIAESMKYLAPSMVAKGWNLSDMLTLTGFATTVGMKANMFSRGMKSFLDANTGDIGEILLAGSPDESVASRYRGLKPKEQKAAGNRMYSKYDKMMSEDLIGFLAKVLSPAWEKALSRGFNAKEFSGTNFLQAVRAILMKSSAEELLQAREIIESGKNIDVVKEHKESLDQESAGTRMDALSGAWGRLTDSIADSSGPVGRLAGGIADFTIAAIDAAAKINEIKNKGWRYIYDGKNFNSAADMHTDMLTDWAEKELNKPDAIKPMFTKLLNIKDKGVAGIYDKPFSPMLPMHHFAASNLGMTMFNVPSVTPQQTEQKTTHEVRGQAEVEVKVNDQGLFEKIKSIIQLYPTTQSGGGLENSTGRHNPTVPQ